MITHERIIDKRSTQTIKKAIFVIHFIPANNIHIYIYNKTITPE